MSARLVALALAAVGLSACGRFGFDATRPAGDDDAGTDATLACAAPTGHDEDGDGIDDGCDGCPHIADPAQIDSDGDGVDDLCDPAPTSPRESIARFDPFVTFEGWDFFGDMPVVANDSATFGASTTYAGIRRVEPIDDDVFVIGGHIGVGLSGSRQVTVSAYENAQAHYYCELFDDGAPHFAETWTLDDVFYQSDALVPITGPVENADFTLVLTNRETTVGCSTTYPAAMQELSASRPAGITPAGVAITVGFLEVRVDYFLQIHSE